MATLFEVGDAVRGDRILIVARRISPQRVINQSARHRAVTVTARENARCVIEMPLFPKPKKYQADS